MCKEFLDNKFCVAKSEKKYISVILKSILHTHMHNVYITMSDKVIHQQPRKNKLRKIKKLDSKLESGASLSTACMFIPQNSKRMNKPQE